MKIKARTDVITNSSSECYIIRNTVGMDRDTFEELWMSWLEEEGLLDKNGKSLNKWYQDNDYSLIGELSWSENEIVVDFPVLSNLPDRVQENLEKIFGKENVIIED